MSEVSKNWLEADNKILELIGERDTLISVLKECVVALEWQVNGFPLRTYLSFQFPATIGHVPIDIHLDKLDEALTHAKSTLSKYER